MFDEILNKPYKPSAGGWDRLARKIELSHQEDIEEVKMWRNIVAALIIGFLTIPFIRGIQLDSIQLNINEPRQGEVFVVDGKAVQVPLSTEGVRFYWLFLDQADAQVKRE